MFAVLIASFNQARYLVETLDSVAAQTCRDFEIVFVNDGSTDDTDAVFASWLSRQTEGQRVIYRRIQNSGQSAAFEHGFGLCRGRYICLLDSDDRWLPNKLESVREVVKLRPEAGMIAHPLYVIDPEGRRTGDIRPKGARISDGDIRDQMLRTARHVAPATTGLVLRNDIFSQLLPMATAEFSFGADGYIAFGASVLAPIAAMDRPLGEYRMHPGGQYLRRLLTPEGLERQCAFQSAVTRRFGLEHAINNNAYYARHAFALAKYRDGFAGQLRIYQTLITATLRDPFYSGGLKAQFILFWTVCLVVPRRLFTSMWRWFQLRQTGYNRISLPTPN